MTINYDLIVIGNTPEAITAVEFATQLGARTALVINKNSSLHSYLEIIDIPINNSFNHYLKNPIPTKDFVKEISSILTEQKYYNLAFLGVDIIFSNSKLEFYPQPQSTLIVNERKLESLYYLIATSSVFVIPKINGIENINYLTPDNIYQKDDLTELPENILIIGESITAIRLAQKLNNIQKTITLSTPNKYILPKEDLDVSFLIQSQLEAEGIKLLTNSYITQIKQIENSKWVQIENKAIEFDEIVIATSLKQPNISSLMLETMKVKLNSQGIKVNKKLQTTNPKIYACGDIIGGYNMLNIAQYEAKIAVKNALFFNQFNVNYNALPYTICINPQIARVGLTERQARKIYGDKMQVLKTNFSELNIAKIEENLTGFCKLIILENGKIIGCHLVGKNVGEFINIIAFAMHNKITLNNIAKLTNSSFTYAEIIEQIAIQWKGDHFQKNNVIIDLLETFFIWRRSWFS